MTLVKDGSVKKLTNEGLIERLLADGWKELKEVKTTKKSKIEA